MGGAPRPPAHRRRRRRPRRPRRRRRRARPASRRSSWRCRRSTGSRCAAATRPGCTCSCGTTGSTSTIPSWPARWPRRGDDPLFPSGAVRVADGAPDVRLQGRGRDRRARRQHRARCAAAIRDDELLRLALAAPTARGHRARPHPLGQRRHHLRAQRPPGQQRGGPATTGGPVRRRRAQRRRRQLRRPARPPTALRIPPPITTDAKVIPTLVSRAGADGAGPRSRRSAGRSARFEGSVAIAAASRRRRPTRCCWPCGAAARRCTSAWPRTLTSWPASRTGWSRRPTATCAWTARRRPTPTSRAAAARSSSLDGDARRRRSRASGGSPTTAPSCPSTPTSSCRPRSRPATSTAATYPHFLLKEITEAPASFRKTLRGKHRRARRPAARRRSATGRCPPAVARRGCATGPSGASLVHRPGHGRGRRRRAWPRCSTRLVPATALRRRGHHRHRAVRASGCAPTCATRWSSPSASPAPPPTPTAPSTWSAAAGAAVIGIVNRRSSDLTDKADGVLYTSDGRDVEMSVASTKAFYAQVAAGVLLACAIAEAAGCGDATSERHELLAGAARAARRACSTVLDAAARDRRGGPPAAPRRAATGRSSATGPTASPPRRSGSSSASSATSRSPATSPRTRSTSTCRPSR